jgi:hypothetical protein
MPYKMLKNIKIKVPFHYIDASPDWKLLTNLILKNKIPMLPNGRVWNPGFMDLFYMFEPQVESRYRTRKETIIHVPKKVRTHSHQMKFAIIFTLIDVSSLPTCN